MRFGKRMHPLVEYHNVSVIRNGRRILDSIDLKIGIGENVAILGPNGSGKSSLIRTITREYRPWTGEEMTWRVMGRENWDIFQLRGMMGLVSMELQERFARDITGREAVLSGFFSSVGINRSHEVTEGMEAKAEEVLRYLQCSHLADRRMGAISLGEGRRLMIARALVNDPATLILDEPMNSLDMKARHIFKTSLQRIAEDGRGIVLVTHDLQDIVPAVSRVIMLKEGRVLHDGPKEEVLTEEGLSDLFDVGISLMRSNGHYAALAEDKSH